MIKPPESYRSNDIKKWEKINKTRNFKIFLAIFVVSTAIVFFPLKFLRLEIGISDTINSVIKLFPLGNDPFNFKFSELLAFDALFGLFITFLTFGVDKSSSIFGQSPTEILRKRSYFYNFLFSKFFLLLLLSSNILSVLHTNIGVILIYFLLIYYLFLLMDSLRFLRYINHIRTNRHLYNFYFQTKQFKEILNLIENSIVIYDSCVTEKFNSIQAFASGAIKENTLDPNIKILILGAIEDFNIDEKYLTLHELKKIFVSNKNSNYSPLIEFLNESLDELVKKKKEKST
uniref:hypothetical protein n=1 Tax=Streptococcus pluranimalium TaxID=82348 RepID=UPI003F68D0F4